MLTGFAYDLSYTPYCPRLTRRLKRPNPVYRSAHPHNKCLLHPRFAVSGFADYRACSILVSTIMTQLSEKRDGFSYELIQSTSDVDRLNHTTRGKSKPEGRLPYIPPVHQPGCHQFLLARYLAR